MARILFVTSSTRVSGAEVCLLTMLEHLDRKRYLPVMACPASSDLVPLARDLGVPVEPVEMSFVRHLGRSRAARMVRYPLMYLKAVRDLVSVVGRRKIDLIHAFLPATLKYAGPAGWIARRPVVGTLHDALVPQNMSTLQLRVAVQVINRFVARMIAVSDYVREVAVQRGAKLCLLETIHNGLDAARMQPARSREQSREAAGIGPDAFVVTCVGRLTPWKGQLQLLKAVQRIQETVPGIQCILAGDAFYPEDHLYKSQLLQFTSDSGLGDTVRLLGQRTDVAEIMRMSDLLVVPSIAPDPFPTVILEGMASGVPIIATSLGGSREMVQDGVNGLLVDPRDESSLACAIRRAWAEPLVRARWADAGRVAVGRDFSLHGYIRRTEDLYSSVLSKKVSG